MPAARSNWRARAVEADGGNPFAHYQLGLSASKASDWGTAVSGFTKAIELKPDFAYAHYYAALAYQRQRQLPKTAEHFDAFLRLAPDAPERSRGDRDSEDHQVEPAGVAIASGC